MTSTNPAPPHTHADSAPLRVVPGASPVRWPPRLRPRAGHGGTPRRASDGQAPDLDGPTVCAEACARVSRMWFGPAGGLWTVASWPTNGRAAPTVRRLCSAPGRGARRYALRSAPGGGARRDSLPPVVGHGAILCP